MIEHNLGVAVQESASDVSQKMFKMESRIKNAIATMLSELNEFPTSKIQRKR